MNSFGVSDGGYGSTGNGVRDNNRDRDGSGAGDGGETITGIKETSSTWMEGAEGSLRGDGVGNGGRGSTVSGMERNSDDRRQRVDGADGKVGGSSRGIRDNSASGDSDGGIPRKVKVRKSNERGLRRAVVVRNPDHVYTRTEVEAILRMALCCPREIKAISPMRWRTGVALIRNPRNQDGGTLRQHPTQHQHAHLPQRMSCSTVRYSIFF